MNPKRLTALLVLAATMMLGEVHASPGSDALIELALPDQAVREIVQLDLQQNGSRVSIATYRAPIGVGESLAFYRSLWPAGETDPGHVENEIGGWRLISRIDGDISTVLQFKADGLGGTEGLISTLERDALATIGSLPVPLPPGGSLVSSTQGVDGTRQANTWVVRSTASPGQVSGHFEDQLDRQGWSLVSDRRHQGGEILLFNRRGSTLELVVSQIDDGSSIAVLNRVATDAS